MRILNEHVPIPDSWRALGLHVGKAGDPATREHLSNVLDAFFIGFVETMKMRDPRKTVVGVPDTARGWAWEGVAMAYTLGALIAEDDLTTVFNRLESAAPDYLPLIYAGIGYAFGRMRRPLSRPPEGAHGVWGWMILDGYGFYLALRRPRRYVERAHPAPDETLGPARRVLYQGLGRSIWFTRSGQPAAIAEGIERLPSEHQGDLWRGVGIAMAYSGRVTPELVNTLLTRAGGWSADLGVGVTVGADARERHGPMEPWTEEAAEIVCRTDAQALRDLARTELAGVDDETRYVTWIDSLKARLAGN